MTQAGPMLNSAWPGPTLLQLQLSSGPHFNTSLASSSSRVFKLQDWCQPYFRAEPSMRGSPPPEEGQKQTVFSVPGHCSAQKHSLSLIQMAPVFARWLKCFSVKQEKKKKTNAGTNRYVGSWPGKCHNTGSTGRRSDAWLVGAKVFLPKVVWRDRVNLCRHDGQPRKLGLDLLHRCTYMHKDEDSQSANSC